MVRKLTVIDENYFRRLADSSTVFIVRIASAVVPHENERACLRYILREMPERHATQLTMTVAAVVTRDARQIVRVCVRACARGNYSDY